MPIDLVQEGRPIGVITAPDQLRLVRFSGMEGISIPYEFDLDMIADNGSVDLKALLYSPVAVWLELPDRTKRYIHGKFRRLVQHGKAPNGLTSYRGELVPSLWFLTHSSNCRMFQNKDVKEIITAVLQAHGITDHRFNLTGSYQKREYCVQYRETDFNFISRLMEEEGIFYFFEHKKDKHTLVMADAKAAFAPCPVQSSVSYATANLGWDDEDVLINVTREEGVHTGKVSLADYDFKKPGTRLYSELADDLKGEHYDYPGDFTQQSGGDRLTRIQLEQQESLYFNLHGVGTCRSFVSGYRFTLKDHYRRDTNQDYTIVSVRHDAGDNNYESGQGAPFHYRNDFEAIPHSVPFRPPHRARKPVVEGLQSAMVVGPSGEEIYVDKYGRVKVHFYWDRDSKKNQDSSVWMRASQPWAGGNWGGMAIPRIGQEVLVAFLEGDPDLPVIVGRVYNDAQMPPYTLPQHMTRTTIRSQSSKGGGLSNFNELRFEDKKGSEQVFLHAEKDLDIRVKNDMRTAVGNDQHEEIARDQCNEIGRDRDDTVGRHFAQTIGSNYALDVGQSYDVNVGREHALEAGQKVHIKGGMQVVIEAGMKLTIKAAGGHITIDPSGIAIVGTMVKINSGGAAATGQGVKKKKPKKPHKADDGSKGTKL